MEGDELDMEMLKDGDAEKEILTNARASKLWRTLRIAAKDQFALFDKVDDGNNLKVLFEAPSQEPADSALADGETVEALEVPSSSAAAAKASDVAEGIESVETVIPMTTVVDMKVVPEEAAVK